VLPSFFLSYIKQFTTALGFRFTENSGRRILAVIANLLFQGRGPGFRVSSKQIKGDAGQKFYGPEKKFRPAVLSLVAEFVFVFWSTTFDTRKGSRNDVATRVFRSRMSI
jgi:hypothetical protein